ncbi:hypothetical protein [Pseudomonas ogarae]|uniref:hypothetical protein n=1 Tax=Pseudomonas ogarae (strain DSM 112162 / CECT 30235 / F113) TaxID=1114970 RepID=UPI001144172E|nr:hypothetical protein [Pseudomonas ogarae]
MNEGVMISAGNDDTAVSFQAFVMNTAQTVVLSGDAGSLISINHMYLCVSIACTDTDCFF